MAYMTGPYRTANELQKQLADTVSMSGTSAFDKAACTRGWIELERLKREMRGIPMLAAHKLKEVLDGRVQRLKSAAATRNEPAFTDPDEPTDIEATPATSAEPRSDQ